jgi:hypothetical protein
MKSFFRLIIIPKCAMKIVQFFTYRVCLRWCQAAKCVEKPYLDKHFGRSKNFMFSIELTLKDIMPIWKHNAWPRHWGKIMHGNVPSKIHSKKIVMVHVSFQGQDIWLEVEHLDSLVVFPRPLDRSYKISLNWDLELHDVINLQFFIELELKMSRSPIQNLFLFCIDNSSNKATKP